MNFKKMFAILLITVLLVSSTGSVFADSKQLTKSEVDKLITVDKSRTLTNNELDELIKEIDKFEKTKGKTSSEKDVLKILKKLNLEDIELLTKEQINQRFNVNSNDSLDSNEFTKPTELMKSSSVPMIGWVLQGRWNVVNTPQVYSIEPFLYNASATTLNQVAGYTRGWVLLTSNRYVKSVERYSNEPTILPGFYRSLGVIHMPIEGRNAYYINQFVLYHNGQAVVLPNATWNNGR